MKKIAALLLTLCMVFALAACGSAAAPAATEAPAAEAETPAAEAETPQLKKLPLPPVIIPSAWAFL